MSRALIASGPPGMSKYLGCHGHLPTVAIGEKELTLESRSTQDLEARPAGTRNLEPHNHNPTSTQIGSGSPSHTDPPPAAPLEPSRPLAIPAPPAFTQRTSNARSEEWPGPGPAPGSQEEKEEERRGERREGAARGERTVA